MNKAQLVARILLGLIFTVFGLNGFLNFLPMPPLPDAAGAFAGALAATGYMFPLIKGIEVVTGIMLLVGFQVPFALLLLAPIAVNILAFHVVLTGLANSGLTIFIALLIAFLAKTYWAHYRNIFAKQAS